MSNDGTSLCVGVEDNRGVAVLQLLENLIHLVFEGRLCRAVVGALAQYEGLDHAHQRVMAQLLMWDLNHVNSLVIIGLNDGIDHVQGDVGEIENRAGILGSVVAFHSDHTANANGCDKHRASSAWLHAAVKGGAL